MAKSKLEKVTKTEEELELSNEAEETVEDSTEDVEDATEEEVEEDVSTDETDGNDSESVDTSQLTVWDLFDKIDAQIKEGYVAHLFPEERECLVKLWELDDLEFIKYSYVVEDNEVKLSEPETIKLVISVREINDKIAEFENQITEKDELILKSSSEVQTLKSEVSELSQYKEKFNEAEQERITAELEAQKEGLISLVVSSGLITREEIEQSEELSGYVAELDKKSLMSEVGQRLADSLGEKADDGKVEVSETLKTNLNNDDSGNDSVSIVQSYLKR